MNLIDLIHRGDDLVTLNGDAVRSRSKWQGHDWRCVHVFNATEAQLSISPIHEIYALRCRPIDTGWYVSASSGTGSLVIEFEDNGVLSRSRIDLSADPVPVTLPWPDDARLLTPQTKLNLSFSCKGKGHAVLLVQRCLSRKRLLEQAVGIGVEIGPGPNPQVFQSESVTDISYVEETLGERWAELYDRTGKRHAKEADWSKYVKGTAANLPSPDASLDFIFSSHVFEHLANPLGHLLRWKKKLKPGGVILGVVPDLQCTKDYKATPSSMATFANELGRDIWEPDEAHYAQWLAVRGGSQTIDHLMQSNTSIHVHYFTPASMALLLQHCVLVHGFAAHHVIWSPNHKDFHFCLWNA